MSVSLKITHQIKIHKHRPNASVRPSQHFHVVS